MNYSLSSLDRGYIRDYVGEEYRVYQRESYSHVYNCSYGDWSKFPIIRGPIFRFPL